MSKTDEKPQQQNPPPADGSAEVAGPAPKQRREIPQADVTLFADTGDLFGIDPSTLDPNMHYRMCYEGQQVQAKRRAQGYRPVSREHDGVQMLTDYQGGQVDDLIRIGDTILMCCPKEFFERRDNDRKRITRGRLTTPEASFRKKAATAPVDVEVVTKKDMRERGRR